MPINDDQFDRLIDNDDNLLICAIDLATHDDDELHKMLIDADMLHSLAIEYDYSPATIARIAQYLTNPHNYTRFAQNYELCPIHRCDYQICIDDQIHD